MRTLWLLVVVLAVVGCSPTVAGTCDATTCVGCCSSSGTCEPGTTALACGAHGRACQPCATACFGGTCTTSTGPNGPGGGSTASTGGGLGGGVVGSMGGGSAGGAVGGGASGGSSGVSTFGSGTLPGRLLVNIGARVGTARRAALFDLGTGRRTLLPLSATPDRDRWNVGLPTAPAVRTVTSGATVTATLFELGALSTVRTLTIADGSGSVLASHDGRFVLAFDGSELTIYEGTGSIVEHGSNLDGFSIIGMPAAWLPDGRYVYLAGKTLYATAPNSPTVSTLATLSLLPGDTPSGVMNVDLAVSPDGSKVAFSWRDSDTDDADLWVVDVTGANLRQLTRSATSALDFTHASPTFSPDGQWVAGVLYMSGTSASPVYPDAPFGGSRVTGTTGCIDQVFVVSLNEPTVQLSWPSFDAQHGVKVFAATGTTGEWLSTCGGRVSWVR